MSDGGGGVRGGEQWRRRSRRKDMTMTMPMVMRRRQKRELAGKADAGEGEAGKEGDREHHRSHYSLGN